MLWQHIQEFLLMGGYGWYVWTAFTAVFFVLVLNILGSLYKQRKTVLKLINVVHRVLNSC